MAVEAIIGVAAAVIGTAIEIWAFWGDHLWHETPKRDPRNSPPPH